MKKLLTLTLVVALSLFTIGCDESTSSTSSSSSSTNSSTGDADNSTAKVASYTTVWYNNGSNYSSVYYDNSYSVTSLPFEGITYDKATSNFNGPLSATADINYVGTANVQDDPYLTHWSDGTSTYSCKPFDGVDYRSRTVYNNEDDYYSSSYYESYVLHEGTASDSVRDDFELDGDIYMNKNVVDNDGKETQLNNDNE
jgi:hypothetical protein